MKKQLILAAIILGSLCLGPLAKAQQFHSNLSTALATSHQTGKPVIAIFSAKWCGPCNTMLKNVYPSAQVNPFHNQFVWAYLDIDQAVNRNILAELKATSVPHLAFIGSDGIPIAQISGAKSADELTTILAVVLQQNSNKGVAQTNKLIRTPKISKPAKQILGGLLNKKN